MTPDEMRQIQDLYHAAREDRGVLNSADPELRRLVESLLAKEGSLPELARTMTRLATGSLLGPYRVEEFLGAGGMGEVFRAIDTRLGRNVALKVSASQFSERFEREARAISALNHPHICTLYDVGPNYLVMEFIEGASLAALLKKGALSRDRVMQYGLQIAEALVEAHAKGITHRDLKPGNIMVTKMGVNKTGIKVLDFGLAKKADETHTLGNAIMGTPAYMAPEQRQGQEADARSDIYSFGLVLFEMATGKRVAPGERPQLDSFPERLAHVLEHCLEQDPDDRWQTARNVKAELEWAAKPGEASSAQGLPAAPALPRRWSWRFAAGFTLVVLAAAAVLLLSGRWRRLSERELQPLVRLDVDLGPDVSLFNNAAGADAILSPDGNRLVYVSQSHLFARRLDQPSAAELPGTEGAEVPFFSPDGRWVGFFTNSRLKKIAVDGGSLVELCDAPTGRGASWGEDGNIIAALTPTSPLSLVSSAGGKPTPVTQLEQGEATHRWPQILPGGKAVLFTVSASATAFDGASIDVISLADHRRKTIQRGATYGRYLPSGHLIYINRGTLFAVPFDLDRLDVRGTPVPVLSEVAYTRSAGSAQLAFSQRGTLVYRSGRGLMIVPWLDAMGKTQALLDRPGDYLHIELSPDGNRLALLSAGDVWVYEAPRFTMTRLTVGGGMHANPTWSPDGRFIVFQDSGGISWTRSDGSGAAQPLTRSKNAQYPYSFSPDSKRLAFYETDPQTLFDVWTVPLEYDAAGLHAGKPEPFLHTSADERHGVFSPDGHWLAYTSSATGLFQVFVRAFPDKGGQWVVSVGDGTFPWWSKNGRELFYRTLGGQVMVVNYTVKGGSFVTDKARPWTDKRLGITDTGRNFDLSPDGKRVAALLPAETAEVQRAQNHVILLENFFDEVRRHFPER